MRRPGDTAAPLLVRIMRRVDKTESCWLWTGSVSGGYGRVYGGDGRRSPVIVHRALYEATVGPIPEGLQLDHLCRNQLCVNPAHLEPVTARENQRRAAEANGDCQYASHCYRGHAFTEDNTRVSVDKHGYEHRVCRTCRAEYMREYMRSYRGAA